MTPTQEPQGGLHRAAEFDATGQYRYWLQRTWRGDRPTLTLVMLNPSRADHQRDDPTVRRCLGLAQGWQFGCLTVVNLFAYCTTSPAVLKTVADPVGPENDLYLRQACDQADQIVLAWGNGGTLHGRDRAVGLLLAPYGDRLYCLGQNRTGQPRHPLYVPRHASRHRWQL